MSVKINVKTTIFQDQNRDMIETSAVGHFYQKDKSSYLQYEETGEEGNIKTIIKIAEKEALILRSGAVKMRLPFVPGRKMSGSCELPFGKLDTTTFTKKIEYSYHAESGEGFIHIYYDFSVQGAPHAGTYQLEITFLEEKE